MATLVSMKVSIPRDMRWCGTVHTAIWKTPQTR
jgi:hypothetical protein